MNRRSGRGTLRKRCWERSVPLWGKRPVVGWWLWVPGRTIRAIGLASCFCRLRIRRFTRPARDDPPFRLATIRRANPSLEYLPSLKAKVLKQRQDARVDPDQLAEWRAYRLNLGVSDVTEQLLLDADLWRRAQGEEAAGRGGAVWGVDLGSGAAMSAVSAYFPSGRLEALAAFPELPSLAQRGLADGVGGQYQKMAARSELITVGRRVADVKALLSEALARFGKPVALVADRWREAELRDALEALRFPQAALITRGQGYRDGGEDVRQFSAGVLGGAG